MNKIEQEKSLALAELMNWRTFKYTCLVGDVYGIDLGGEPEFVTGYMLKPYASDLHGYAQFAAILLANLWVFEDADGDVNLLTQADILDNILKGHKNWQEAWKK